MNSQRFGTSTQPRQPMHDRKAFGAAEECHEEEGEQCPFDERDCRTFSATEQSNNDGLNEEDGEDR